MAPAMESDSETRTQAAQTPLLAFAFTTMTPVTEAEVLGVLALSLSVQPLASYFSSTVARIIAVVDSVLSVIVSVMAAVAPLAALATSQDTQEAESGVRKSARCACGAIGSLRSRLMRVAAVQMAKEERRAAAEAARAHALAQAVQIVRVTYCSLKPRRPLCAHYAYRSLRPWHVVVLGAAAPKMKAGWRMSGQSASERPQTTRAPRKGGSLRGWRWSCDRPPSLSCKPSTASHHAVLGGYGALRHAHSREPIALQANMQTTHSCRAADRREDQLMTATHPMHTCASRRGSHAAHHRPAPRP